MTNLTLLFCFAGIAAMAMLPTHGAPQPDDRGSDAAGPERDPNGPGDRPQTQPPGDHEHHPPPGDDTDDATMHHSFADVKQWVERFDDPARAEWQKPEDVVKALDLRPGMNVADIGAGTG